MTTAGIVAATLLSAIAIFQIALALGAPWGRAAWGGQHPGALPFRLRVASAVAGVVIYPAVIAVVLSAAGLAGDWLGGTARTVMWSLAAFFALGTVMNAISRSKPERAWAVVSLGVAVACALVASRL